MKNPSRPPALVPGHSPAFASVAALLALLGPPQDPQGADPDATPPVELPEGAVAVVGDVVISADDYHHYLILSSGRRPLDELIGEVLVEREAARLGVEVSAAELAEDVSRFWESMLARHRGDSASLSNELAQQGFREAEYRQLYERRRRREMLAAKICVATRALSDEAVLEYFEREHGVGGIGVEVRHIYWNKARARRELVPPGGPPADDATLERLLTERTGDVLRRLRAGADFASVAREESHDLSVHKNDGFIPRYNYRRYGAEMAKAVRAAEIGVPTGPVRTETGMHVIEVTARTETRLADVRDEILAALRAEPASGRELQALELRLRAETPVQTY